MLHLFNIFRENKDSDNCAKMLEEEYNKMFGIQSLNDELASTHQIGKIDFSRGISIWKLNGCMKG